MKRCVNFLLSGLKKIYGRINDDKIPVYAAQATLFIIISALPFLMLMVSMLKFILPHTQGDLVEMGGKFLPTAVIPFVNSIIGEIYSGSTIPIASVTTVTTLWAASKGVMALLTGLDNIYHLERGYVKSRLRSLIYTLVILVALCITLMLFVISGQLVGMSETVFPIIHAVSSFLSGFPSIIYLVILTLVFASLYMLLPGQRLSFCNQLAGAFMAAVGWVIFSLIYSAYINNFTNYSLIYGSLTAIVLLMLWLYFCMNIFLCGAEINEFLEKRKKELN